MSSEDDIGGDLETGTAKAAVSVEHWFDTSQNLNTLHFPGAQVLITTQDARTQTVSPG